MTRQILIGEAGSGKTYAAQRYAGSSPDVVVVDGCDGLPPQAIADAWHATAADEIILITQTPESVADYLATADAVILFRQHRHVLQWYADYPPCGQVIEPARLDALRYAQQGKGIVITPDGITAIV